MNSQAVGWDDIEANPGKDHDVLGFGILVQGMQRFKNGDFSRDIQVMRPGSQAGCRHLPGGVSEGTCAMQNQRGVRQAAVESICFIKGSHTVFDTQLLSLFFDGFAIPAGKDRLQAQIHGALCNGPANRARRTIDNEI